MVSESNLHSFVACLHDTTKARCCDICLIIYSSPLQGSMLWREKKWISYCTILLTQHCPPLFPYFVRERHLMISYVNLLPGKGEKGIYIFKTKRGFRQYAGLLNRSMCKSSNSGILQNFSSSRILDKEVNEVDGIWTKEKEPGLMSKAKVSMDCCSIQSCTETWKNVHWQEPYNLQVNPIR